MATTSSAATTSNVSQNQFLQLMIKQLQSQDPLSPTDNGQMLAQLAQFSTLSGMEKLNTSFSDMLSLQQITQGSNLIGKEVSYTGTDGKTASGVVSAVGVDNGSINLQIGSNSVALSSVQTVAPATSS